jgi:hypothetical protein
VLESFKALQVANQRRNAAVTANLKRAADPTTKLHKIVRPTDQQDGHIPLEVRVRQYLHPDSNFRAVWDVVGLLILLYYIFSIPFYVAFLFERKLDIYFEFVPFDFCLDGYWVLDIFLKCYLFSFKLNLFNDKVVTDGEAIFAHYRHNGFLYVDLVASIPLELIVIIPGIQRITLVISRMIHLLRVPQIFLYMDLVEHHLQKKFGVTIQRALALVAKAAMGWVIINHWLACGFFSIHRYAERGQSLTYVIADLHATFDPVKGEHDICNTRLSYCYARQVYFVVSSLSGVGIGDILPFKNRELLMQWAVDLCGAYGVACLTGFIVMYFEDRDANGEARYKRKVADLSTYFTFRQLEPQLRDAILAHYAYIWRKLKSVTSNRNEIVHSLSNSLAMELSLHLHAKIIDRVPVLAESSQPIRRRLAVALKPQVCTDY